MLAPPDSTALDRSLSAGPATCGGSAASPAGAMACGERAGAPWRWAPTRQRCSRGGPPTWRCVQQWQVQVSSRGRSLCLAHLPATAPPAKPRILAPRTPRSRPSSSALVFDSASASAHTTCLAARDTTGARSAGRVHAGPESAASRLIASASMLECCVRSLIAMQCNRPITGGIIRERSARRKKKEEEEEAKPFDFLRKQLYVWCTVTTHPSIRGLVYIWAHSRRQAPPSAPRFKVGRAAPPNSRGQ